MTTGTRSEVTAARVAAEPERRSAPAALPRALPEAVLSLQRTAGNAAVARAVGRPAARAVQRCGAGCGCGTCSSGHAEDELLEEQLGAGLLRSAVARRTA